MSARIVSPHCHNFSCLGVSESTVQKKEYLVTLEGMNFDWLSVASEDVFCALCSGVDIRLSAPYRSIRLGVLK